MSHQPLLHQLSFRLAMLAAVTCQVLAVQTACCQTNHSAANASAAETGGQTAAKPTGEDMDPATTKAVTVNPNVTTAHLKLFVKPLTVAELEVEAKGWQNLLKTNVENITTIHLRIEQITEQISKLKDANAREPEQASSPAPTEASDDDKSENLATSNQQNPDPGTSNSTPPVPPFSPTGTQSTEASANESAPHSSQAPTVESLSEQRDQLSSQLTELTLKKTEISQKFEVVLASLALKGGDPTPYRKYNDALTGVAMEVTTASGMWQMFIGWVVAEQGGKRWAWNLIRFIVILCVSYFGASILANFVRRGASRVKGVSQLLVNFLSSFTKQLSMVVGFIIGLAALEIDITPLIAAVGAAGFVVAFALQGTLSNFASGLLILAYRPFDVGDVIEAAGVSGNVDSVSLFSTHIRTFDNKLMIVPNNDIWGGTITNATASTTRRVDLVFGIGYTDDINEAKNILVKVVKNHPLVLKDPAANIRVNELGDSSVNLICRPWTKTENYWSVYWDLMHTVKQEFDNAGVSIPFPQRDVHVYQQNSND